MSLSLKLKNELRKTIQGDLLFDEPLARYTSIKVGGPADVLFYPASLEEIPKALGFCKARSLSCWVLGNGSNLLIRDGGIRGMVLRLNRLLQQFEILEEKEGEVFLKAESGLSLAKLVEFSRSQGLSGMESLYGIPGSVGGAVIMNAGTREGEIGALIETLTVMNAAGEIKEYPKKKLHFEYRDLEIPRSEIILSTVLKLQKSTPEKVSQKIEFFQKRRRDTQPLDQPNMGSVFKNPPKKFAAQLIEELGLKGVRVGQARISEKHSNWIVNEGGATAKDIVVLMGLVRDKVREAAGVRLEIEVKIVGEDTEEDLQEAVNL